MKQNFLKLLVIIALVAVLVCLIVAAIGAIGSMRLTDGCLMRYNLDASGNNVNADKIMKTITLKANSNYTIINTPSPDGRVAASLDPAHYGEWLNTNLTVTAGQEVNLSIKGEVSLCRAYIPKNNLESLLDVDNQGARIPIPKIEESDSAPASLVFNATTDEWRNIAELYRNDKIIVSVNAERTEQRDEKGNITNDVQNIIHQNIFTHTLMNADCRQDKRSYSPLCGRYSIYGGNYVSNCQWIDDCYDCNCERKCVTVTGLPWFFGLFGECAGNVVIQCERCGCWQNVMGQAPEPFKNDGRYTCPWSDNLANLYTDFNPQCSDSSYVEKDKDYIMGDYQNKKYFWYSATTATGLLYRLDTSETPTNAKTRGSTYSFAKVDTDQSGYNNDPNFNIIYNITYSTGDKAYLQYRFHDNDNGFADNTGGYILNIKQTKCRRTDGAILNDTVASRGKVEYMIVSVGQDANDPANTYSKETIVTNSTGNANITAGDTPGNIWMRIYNDPADYKDSTGQYIVQFFTTQSVGSFTVNILDPLFETLKGKIKTASQTVFKNMTCYQAGANTSASCVNFFNYIKGMLTLYIMVYGALFLLGMVEISQLDLVIRVIKIAIVAGLMNERTFDLFNNYVFDFVTGFSDQIISNMAGYSLFTTTGKITNPFTFLDALMSKILFSKTFMGQVLALISMGISGVLYFIIIFIAVIVIIITALRAVAVYLMAFMAIAVLIGLAPLFLTFILFDFTRYLFDNWAKFTFRYMLEPTILMAGIIILTQLFTIYLDFAVGYSVCWKCALPIKIPFPAIPGIEFAFTNVELFCINWFVPWGYDHRTGMMGINMQHLIALMMIAYCMYGYTELSSKMVMKLTSGIGGPSATQMGKSMSSSMGNKAMSSVGLSKENRANITGGMKERGKQKLTEGVAKLKRSGGDSSKSPSGGGAKPGSSSPAPKPPTTPTTGGSGSSR